MLSPKNQGFIEQAVGGHVVKLLVYNKEIYSHR